MRTKSQNFIVGLMVYPFDVMVSIGEEDDILFKHLKKFGIEDDSDLEGTKFQENGNGRFCSFSTGAMLIRLKKKPVTPADYGCLQHEIFHIVATLMWKVGMKLKILVSCEAYAYLTGYLTREIYGKIK